ncbi:MAG: alpha/beta hydrolase [Rickettsiales bacterium]|jgi:monoterpene epsilon-lactone hydrolase
MAKSEALEKILAAKRADTYTPEKTLEELRAQRGGSNAPPLPEGAVYAAVDANGVPGEWIEGQGAAQDKVFLFFHGGGYYRGTVVDTRATAARISAASGMRCLSIDYRLAPEHPFPAAVDDAYAAYRFILEQGVAPARIAVGGISAGGGLTLALLLKLKETGDPLPGAAVPMSAWTDLAQTGESLQSKADVDPIISKLYLDRMAGYYLNGADAETPLASPLYGDLSGLPPLLIQIGDAETLLDDSSRLAERARAAGVDVTYEPWEDMFHGWHSSAHILPEAQQAIDSIGKFCRSVVGP